MEITRTHTSQTISTVEITKQIRQALKAEFAGTKFAVRLAQGDGGCVCINWASGPSVDEVYAAAGEQPVMVLADRAWDVA